MMRNRSKSNSRSWLGTPGSGVLPASTVTHALSLFGTSLFHQSMKQHCRPHPCSSTRVRVDSNDLYLIVDTLSDALASRLSHLDSDWPALPKGSRDDYRPFATPPQKTSSTIPHSNNLRPLNPSVAQSHKAPLPISSTNEDNVTLPPPQLRLQARLQLQRATELRKDRGDRSSHGCPRAQGRLKRKGLYSLCPRDESWE